MSEKEKKLTENDLENLVDVWRMGCQSDTKKEYENCKKCPSKKICKQAYTQLKEMIQQKPKVTRTEIENAVGDTSDEYTEGVFELFEEKGFIVEERT